MSSSRDSNDSVLANSTGEPAGPIEADAHSAGVDPAAETMAPNGAPKDLAGSESKGGTDSAPAAQQAETAPQELGAAAAAKSEVQPPSGGLIPFIIPPQRSEAPPRSNGGEFWRTAFERRFQIGAIAAALALAGVITASAISYGSQQAHSLEAQNAETQNLGETVKALKARINALEAARRDEVADLRKTTSELKSGLGTTRDVNSTLAQLSARFDRLEHDQDSRIEKLGERVDRDAAAHNADFTNRLEKLGERLDHDAAAHNADFAARLEKLEKKLAAPVVASLAQPQSAPASPPPRPPTATPVAAGVSKETTGSIAPAREPIRGWIVREVHDGVAIVEGPYGFREIAPGQILPGAGRVERIERRGNDWAVVTNQGAILGAPEGDY